MEQSDVIIIGAGWSGLVACKFCLEEKLTVRVLERRGDLGGVWNYTPDPTIPTVMTTTHATSSSTLTEMSDFPMPAELGEFPHHAAMLGYLRGYAEHFELLPYLTFNAAVVRAQQTPDPATGETHWIVSTATGAAYRSKFLIVCSGLVQKPNDEARRTIFAQVPLVHHSCEIKERLPEHQGRTILLVGGGETASDIALELVRDGYARRVYWSIANGQHFFRKQGKWLPENGKLQQHFPALVQRLATKPWDKAVSTRGVKLVTDFHRSKPGMRWACKWTTNFSLAAYGGHGIPEWKSDTPFFRRFINKSSEILDYIDYDRVVPKPGITHCAGQQVFFADQSASDVDAVILCTGYRTAFPFLPPHLGQGAVDSRYKFVWDTRDETIAFVGFVRPIIGSIPILAEAQARWAARVFSQRVSLAAPAERAKIAAEDQAWWGDFFQHSSRRLRNVVEAFKYIDEVAALSDSSPNYWGLFRRDPVKWFWAVTSPLNACHFLLNDPTQDEQNLRTLRHHRDPRVLMPLVSILVILLTRVLQIDRVIDWLGAAKYRRDVAKQLAHERKESGRVRQWDGETVRR